MGASIPPIQPADGWERCLFKCVGQSCDRCRRSLTSDDERLYWRSVDYWSEDGEYWCLACCNTEIA